MGCVAEPVGRSEAGRCLSRSSANAPGEESLVLVAPGVEQPNPSASCVALRHRSFPATLLQQTSSFWIFLLVSPDAHVSALSFLVALPVVPPEQAWSDADTE